MINILKNLHGRFYKIILPWLVYPPGQTVNGQFMTYHRQNLTNFLNTWKPKLLGNVLDLGAGTWEYPRKLLKDQCHYLSVDTFFHPNVDLVADAQHLDQYLEPDSWDFILCFDVLEHTQVPIDIILQSRRLLKAGGIFLVTTPYFYPLHGNNQTKDYWRLSPDALQYLLAEKSGFSLVDVQSQGNPRYPFTVTASAKK